MEFAFYSRKQKPTESTIEYSLKLEKLARKAFGNVNKDNDILKIFWDGLKYEIRKLIITAIPKNIAEALEYAQKAEKLIGRESKQLPNKIEDVVPINAIQTNKPRGPSRSPSPHRYKERSKTHYKRSTSPSRKCYKCEKPAHIASECRTKTPSRAKRSTNCYKCGKPGHIAAKCYSNNY